MPVSAVRMSCANTASTASLAAGTAARRRDVFRGLRRAGLTVDFCLVLDRAIAIPQGASIHHGMAVGATKQAARRSAPLKFSGPTRPCA
jgi:hypothetical protein